jgi:hypothetical protein
MTRFAFLLAAMALTMSTVAARDGCHRGQFFNGVTCTPEEGVLYAPYFGGYAYDSPRYFSPGTRYYKALRPVGKNNDGAIYCMIPGYTWQNGDCRPYRGH